MNIVVRLGIVAALAVLAAPSADAQTRRFSTSGGEVDSRFAPRIPGLTDEQRARVRVSGDSAQRIALQDFAWKGRVVSLEIDEEDARLYWDVKVAPDAKRGTIVRYRIDAASGGILGIKEFTGLRISKP